MSRSALSGDPVALTLATNHSIFIKMTLSKVIRAQEGISRPQSGTPTTKAAGIGQKCPQSSQKYHAPLCQATPQLLHRQRPLLFHQMTLSKSIRAQERIPRSQSGSPAKKMPDLAKKRQKSPQKYHVLLCQGTQCFNSNQPVYFQ